jgi:hypothetical protein
VRPKRKKSPNSGDISNMVGFLDIAPSTKQVMVGGEAVDVYGVTLKGAVELVRNYPKFMGIFLGGGVTSEALFASGPDLVSAVVAAGLGYSGKKAVAAAEKALQLPLQAQFDLLEAIIEVTMPDGPGPFVKRLTGCLNSMAAGNRAAGASEDQNGPSIGTAPGITLRQPSTGSLPLDTAQPTSGK